MITTVQRTEKGRNFNLVAVFYNCFLTYFHVMYLYIALNYIEY